MNIKVIRYSSQSKDTLSLIYINDAFFCYGLEDEYRAIKLRGETRIPEGTYELNYLKSDTPMTLSYKKKYPWFKWHLEVKNVPNFSNVYIHIGNKESETDGCLLVGDTANTNVNTFGFISNSTATFQRLYKVVSDTLDKNEKINITFSNISK